MLGGEQTLASCWVSGTGLAPTVSILRSSTYPATNEYCVMCLIIPQLVDLLRLGCFTSLFHRRLLLPYLFPRDNKTHHPTYFYSFIVLHPVYYSSGVIHTICTTVLGLSASYSLKTCSSCISLSFSITMPSIESNSILRYASMSPCTLFLK